MKELVFLTGLPRSGSTLVCNVLAQHPEIEASPSSPLCHLVEGLKRSWSDDPFLLSQLDGDFAAVYERLGRSLRAFIDAWSDSPKRFRVDKNRGWLRALETMRELYPRVKMIVCLRDLVDVFASIEKQHAKTRLLDFPDHMDSHDMDARADSLFARKGIIGSAAHSIGNLQNIEQAGRHLYLLRYEDLVANPPAVLASMVEFIGAEPYSFDLNNVEQRTRESDSYYRFKYPHKVAERIEPRDERFPIPLQIEQEIRRRFQWFYELYYPERRLKSGPRTSG